MPILHSSGVITPGQFGADEHRLRPLDHGVDAGHVQDRHPSVMATTVGCPHRPPRGWRRREGGGDEDHRGVGPGLLHGLDDRVEDGQPLDRFAPFAGRDAADHPRPVFLAALGVELPPAVMPWQMTRVSLLIKNAVFALIERVQDDKDVERFLNEYQEDLSVVNARRTRSAREAN